MESYEQFISDQEHFKNLVSSMLESDGHSEIFISGAWDMNLYKVLIDKIVETNYSKKCKILVPNITSNKGIYKSHINKIHKHGGVVKINSLFNNSIVVIGDTAFVVSFSCKVNKDNSIKNCFECCMITKCQDTVNKIKEILIDRWNRSFPLTV